MSNEKEKLFSDLQSLGALQKPAKKSSFFASKRLSKLNLNQLSEEITGNESIQKANFLKNSKEISKEKEAKKKKSSGKMTTILLKPPETSNSPLNAKNWSMNELLPEKYDKKQIKDSLFDFSMKYIREFNKTEAHDEESHIFRREKRNTNIGFRSPERKPSFHAISSFHLFSPRKEHKHIPEEQEESRNILMPISCEYAKEIEKKEDHNKAGVEIKHNNYFQSSKSLNFLPPSYSNKSFVIT